MERLEYAAYVDWMRDEVEWLLGVEDTDLNQPVPSCPGWDIAAVLDHLARGAGMGWSTWFAGSADINGLQVLLDLPEATTGTAAKALFAETMPAYVDQLSAIDPGKECFWFTGPVTALWLISLGANEVAMHRGDVAVALGESPALNGPRAADALAKTAEFMPQLWTMRRGGDPPPGAVTLAPTDVGEVIQIGAGVPTATVSGSASDLRLRLWGRSPEKDLAVDGDGEAFEKWTTTGHGPGPLG